MLTTDSSSIPNSCGQKRIKWPLQAFILLKCNPNPTLMLMIATGPILPVREQKFLITVNSSPSLGVRLIFWKLLILSYIGEKGQLDIFESRFWVRLGFETVLSEGAVDRDSWKYFESHLKLQMHFRESVGGTVTHIVRRLWRLLGVLSSKVRSWGKVDLTLQ